MASPSPSTPDFPDGAIIMVVPLPTIRATTIAAALSDTAPIVADAPAHLADPAVRAALAAAFPHLLLSPPEAPTHPAALVATASLNVPAVRDPTISAFCHPVVSPMGAPAHPAALRSPGPLFPNLPLSSVRRSAPEATTATTTTPAAPPAQLLPIHAVLLPPIPKPNISKVPAAAIPALAKKAQASPTVRHRVVQAPVAGASTNLRPYHGPRPVAPPTTGRIRHPRIRLTRGARARRIEQLYRELGEMFGEEAEEVREEEVDEEEEEDDEEEGEDDDEEEEDEQEERRAAGYQAKNRSEGSGHMFVR